MSVLIPNKISLQLAEFVHRIMEATYLVTWREPAYLDVPLTSIVYVHPLTAQHVHTINVSMHANQPCHSFTELTELDFI